MVFISIGMAIPFLLFGVEDQFGKVFAPLPFRDTSIKNILFCISILDPEIQCLCLLLKMLVMLFPSPKKHMWLANTRKRKLYAILEDCSYVTRLLVNIPFWMYYFQVLFHTNGYIKSIPLSILRFPMVFTYVVYKVL